MNRVLVILTLLAQCLTVFSQGFERVYTDQGNESCYLMRQGDNNLHITYIEEANVDRVRTASIDYNGNISYHAATLDTSDSDSWYTRLTYGADNTLLVASAKHVSQYQTDIILAKYDSLNNLIWATEISDAFVKRTMDIEEGVDKSVYIMMNLSGETDDRVMKFDSLGNHMWTRNIFGTLNSIVPTADGGCLAFKWIYGQPLDHERLIKIGPLGHVTHSIDGMNEDNFSPNQSIPTKDGGFVTASEPDSSQSIIGGGWVSINKYDSALDSVWQFRRGDSVSSYVQPTEVIETKAGQIIFTGPIIDYSVNSYVGIYLAMLSADGTLIWWREYMLGSRTPYSIVQSNNGNLYIAGNAQYPSNSLDIWIMVVDSLGSYTENSLSGKVFLEDGLVCRYDTTEAPLANWLVELEGSFASNYMTSGTNGKYYVQTQIDSYTVNIVPLSPYWNPCIINYPQVFSNPVQHDTLNIGVQPAVQCPWLELSISGFCAVRPAGPGHFTFKYCNYGTVTAENISIDVNLPSNFNATHFPLPYTQNGQVYTFMLDSLGVNECEHFTILGTVDTTTPIGSTLCASAHISPDSICIVDYNGYDPFNFTFCSTVVGSFDPNIKTSNPFGETDDHIIARDTRLNYNIQFQNTGTDTAFKVVIIDTLPKELDVTTIKPGASSHPYTYEVYGQGIVRFTFDPIALPDSNVNLSESMGYVGFSISHDTTLADGASFENTAAIYFDFNAPVITDPWKYTLETPTSLTAPTFTNKLKLHIYPNPTSGLFMVNGQIDRRGKAKITIRNVMGKTVEVVETELANGGFVQSIDLRAQASGLYFITVESNGLRSTNKLLKQ